MYITFRNFTAPFIKISAFEKKQGFSIRRSFDFYALVTTHESHFDKILRRVRLTLNVTTSRAADSTSYFTRVLKQIQWTLLRVVLVLCCRKKSENFEVSWS